jgi:hypothetical protein
MSFRCCFRCCLSFSLFIIKIERADKKCFKGTEVRLVNDFNNDIRMKGYR